jgi:beta-lactamase class A
VLKVGGLALTGLAVLALTASVVVVVLPQALTAFSAAKPSPLPTPVAAVAPSPSPPPIPTPAHAPIVRAADVQKLSADLARIVSSGGARAGVSIIELAGTAPLGLWSMNGDVPWEADSTYKLPLLIAEAQGISSGTIHRSDKLCYKVSDFETGWFDDYAPGKCFTRDVLAQRVGHYSDNTAAHILIRYLGGSGALNAYARTLGASDSKFFLPNTTTSADLARLWAAEAGGAAGGAAAQAWLYPLITHTRWESGIPAGTPNGTVVHKIGFDGHSLNDAALVLNGPKGPYILTVCTYGPGGAAGWQIIARIATTVWNFESARPA